MENFKELIEGDVPVLVDFFATWCGPCKMMHPVLDQLKDKVGDKAHILKVDIDNPANQALVTQYGIRSVPTLIVFRSGEAIWRQSGTATVEQLEKELMSR